MTDPVRELKIRAELLHHRIAADTDGAAPSTSRLRALPELRRASAPEIAAFAKQVQRKHCLAVVARELGFQSWDHAVRVLRGEGDEPDFGDLLSPQAPAAFLNRWFASYDEAHAAHEPGSYLLAYRRQTFLAGRDYVAQTLALDPDDADWRAIGFDWIRPRDPEARRRLYGKLLTAKRAA